MGARGCDAALRTMAIPPGRRRVRAHRPAPRGRAPILARFRRRGSAAARERQRSGAHRDAPDRGERAPGLGRAPPRLLLRARLVAPLLYGAAHRGRCLRRGGAEAGAPGPAHALAAAGVRGRRRGCAAPRGPGNRALRGSAYRGSSTVKVEPRPGSLLRLIVPPCASTTRRGIHSPRPNPPNRRGDTGPPTYPNPPQRAAGSLPLPQTRTPAPAPP